MTTFTSFANRLPDPNYKINSAGAYDSSGTAGPGFAKVSFTSAHQVQTSRTISGRGVNMSPGSHGWEFSISYNPMTREEFEPVNSFLEQRRGNLIPFYVVLPQYSSPRDPTFATYTSSTNPALASAYTSGTSAIMINVPSGSGSPSVGDYLNISDSEDANHKKVYKVARVETNSTYQIGTTAPTANQRRIHLVPPLTRSTSTSAVAVFTNPMFRVTTKGSLLEYTLETDNLYQYSLNLEETLP